MINSIKSSTQTQEDKIESLESLNENINEYISDVVTIDEEAADAINKSKDDFYDKYYYLKPECEKSGWEKFKDGCKKVGEWCKEHWKVIVTIVIVIAAVVCLFIPGVNAAIAGLAYGKLILAMSVGVLKGAAIGSILGGILGGIYNAETGKSFWQGFANGMENGAFSGAMFGGIFGGLGFAGQTSVLPNVISGGLCSAFGISGIINSTKMYKEGAPVSGTLGIIMSAFCFYGAGRSFYQAHNVNIQIKSQPISIALQKLEMTNLKPGQTQISAERVMEIVSDFNSSKAQSSIYSDGINRYVVEGHHTTVAAQMAGKGITGNMGALTNDPPAATNVCWWAEWYEFWKKPIKVR